MQATPFVSALIILIAMLFTYEIDANRLQQCRNPGSSCEDNCDECLWGTIYNRNCDFYECAKGPGQRCGGLRGGTCGEGLRCLCNRCHGCSTSSIGDACYNDACLPHEDYEWLRGPQFTNV